VANKKQSARTSVLGAFGEELQSKAELLTQLTQERSKREAAAGSSNANANGNASTRPNISINTNINTNATPGAARAGLYRSLSQELVHANPLRSSHLWSKKSFDMFKRMQEYVSTDPACRLPDCGILARYSKGDAIGVVDTYYPATTAWSTDTERDCLEHCSADWVFFKSRFEVSKVGTYAVVCCAVLCCAVLCCAMLCYAMLCYAVLCCAMLCYAVLCCAMLCCAMLYYAMLCYAMMGWDGI
jgi:hypothetical protein